jgi:hypothetical protein
MSMRKALLMLPMLLTAGCQNMFPPPEPPHFEGMCDAAAAQRFIGQPVSQEAGDAIKAAARVTFFRWAAPDMMMTMEYNPSRITVHYGTDYRISSIVCG